jgi:hypothetical protein
MIGGSKKVITAREENTLNEQIAATQGLPDFRLPTGG